MAIKREYHVPLSTLSTFRIGGFAKEVVTVENESDLNELFKELPQGGRWFILGGGSNVVFPDGDVDMLIIRLASGKIMLEDHESGDVFLLAPGGNVWDDVVAFAVQNNLSGIEALSAIPGTVGATPVQNVGAYGTEIKDVFVSLEAFDVVDRKTVMFSKEACEFAYRESYFKREGKGRFIITQVRFRLSHQKAKVPDYPGVAEYFSERNILDPSIQEIREAIITIRWRKLPDPRDIASVGSFFKNPFVSAEHAEMLKNKFPTLKTFPGNNGKVKVPAGALIDLAGLKGKRFGNLSLYKNNALVIVNEGNATRKELAELVETIIDSVYKLFEIRLEPEPELI